MRAGEIIERIRHMLKVKDCKHVCLFCEYYDMCKEEAKGIYCGGGRPCECVRGIQRHSFIWNRRHGHTCIKENPNERKTEDCQNKRISGNTEKEHG